LGSRGEIYGVDVDVESKCEKNFINSIQILGECRLSIAICRYKNMTDTV